MFEDGNNRVSSCDNPNDISSKDRISSYDYQANTTNNEPFKENILDEAKKLTGKTSEAISNTFNNIGRRARQTMSGLIIALSLTGGIPTFSSCEKPDITAPKITPTSRTIDADKGEKLKVTVQGNKLSIGKYEICFWQDDRVENCNFSMTISRKDSTGKTHTQEIKPGDYIDTSNIQTATITCTVTISDGKNTSTLTCTINIKDLIENQKPTITILATDTIDVSEPKQFVVDLAKNHNITIGDKIIATLNDEDLSTCTVSSKLTKTGEQQGKNVASGDWVGEDGDLTITITDKGGLYDQGNVTLSVNNVVENQKPNITVLKPGGVTSQGEIKVYINKDNNTVILGSEPTDEPAISWSDDRTNDCNVSITFKKNNEDQAKPVQSGSILFSKGEEGQGELKVVIDDKEGGKNDAKINVTKQAPNLVNGLENIKGLSLQIDKEINLLQGVKFSDGVTLEKLEIEINGKRYPVNYTQQDQGVYSAYYIPQIPGTYKIILTINGNGSNEEIMVNIDKTLNPLEYKNSTLETVDYINNQYSWVNNLSPENQEFIKDHVLISYITSEWYKLDNLEYIIAGEAPTDYYQCENVGLERPSQHTNHADRGCKGIADMAPGATIKACGGNIMHLEDYAKSHPDKMLMVSCAVDNLSIPSHDSFIEDVAYKLLNEIFDTYKNCVFSISVGNAEAGRSKKLNEDQPEQEGGWYTQASINPDLDNKFTVSGYNNSKNNIFGDDLESARPIGFGKEKKNIVVAFIQPTDQLNQQEESTRSSYPTGFRNSTLGNHLSVLVYNYHTTTLEQANKIFIQTYLIPETFRYKDPSDGKIKEGESRYFVDTNKFKNNEILHKPEIDVVQLNNEITALPSGHGIYYLGPSIEFEYQGKRYNPSDNYDIRQTAISSGKDIQYYSNVTLDIKRGGKGTTSFTVGMLNKSGKRIPDIITTITKNYDYEYFTNKINQSNYQQPSYNQPNYQRPNYQQPSYNQPGYDQPNYD